MEFSFEAGSWWSYLLVFLAAATPVVEVLVVIPAGVLAGLSPAATTLVAAAGNLSTVILVAVAGDRILGWWRRRRRSDQSGQADQSDQSDRPGQSDQSGQSDRPGDRPSRRSQRARELARRWGVPGLAMLAPLTTGTHIATVAALATGSETRRVLWWMALGIALWSVAIGVTTVVGVDIFA